MRCVNGFTIKVLKSGAGYYIGTLDENGFPNCRISENYFGKKEDAEKALETMSFNFRYAMENRFCYGHNGHVSCFIKGGGK